MAMGYSSFVFAALKNDPFGEHFGSKPAWLPYSGAAPRNACRSLVALELAAARAGLVPDRRSSTFLFGPSFGAAWYHSLIDRLFNFLLRCGAGLSTEEAHKYSMHSWRIYLACALYAAGCSNDRIMAMLRWRSEEALLIYARFNDSERAHWVALSLDQKVDSTVAARLPRLDAYDLTASLQEAVRSGVLGPEARADDRDAELPT
jgi:hypothetical protein